MSNFKTRVSTIPEEKRLIVSQYSESIALNLLEYRKPLRVECPLPDGFGLSVGSAFSDPYNEMFGEGGGNFASAARILGNIGGVSRKMGFRTKLYYSGPEPTEISFDMNFMSYYSAKHEVIIPCLKLMMMSVGRDVSVQRLIDAAASVTPTETTATGEFVKEASKNAVGEAAEAITGSDEGIGLIFAPGLCRIKFGNALQIDRGYISSVGVRFSNMLDNEYLPQSATASVTVRLEQNPTQRQVLDMFRNAGV